MILIMAKTSIHIKSCNIGQSEAHNKRTKEYLAHINADKLYIREDLTSCNQSWIAEQQQGLSLQQYYDNIGKMVKEKTGRAMQTKDCLLYTSHLKVTLFSANAPVNKGDFRYGNSH